MSIVELADIAADQWGLCTTTQAARVGQNHQALARLTRRGILERIAHGVYRIAGVPPHRLDELRAAWLALAPRDTAAARLRSGEPGGVVSHRSAAMLHELGDLDADVHEFTTPTRRQTRRPDVRFHRGHLRPDDWTVIDGLPITTPLRTIRDLAAARLDGGHLANIVRDAVSLKQVEADPLDRIMRQYARQYGSSGNLQQTSDN